MGILQFIKDWFTIKVPEEQPNINRAKPKKVYVPIEPHYYKHEVEQIRTLAKATGYTEIDLQEQNKMISFRKDDVRINIYYSTMTVGTCLNHPKQGKTQLFRRGVTMRKLEQLFINPRLHTGSGYKERAI